MVVDIKYHHFLIQIKFDSDTIDETDLLEETLKSRIESYGGKLEKVVLRGNHITPCVQVLQQAINPLVFVMFPQRERFIAVT